MPVNGATVEPVPPAPGVLPAVPHLPWVQTRLWHSAALVQVDPGARFVGAVQRPFTHCWLAQVLPSTQLVLAAVPGVLPKHWPALHTPLRHSVPDVQGCWFDLPPLTLGFESDCDELQA
jgi:hypothetical protein